MLAHHHCWPSSTAAIPLTRNQTAWSINEANIALCSKTNGATSIRDFQPFSLIINSLAKNKIITKIVAERSAPRSSCQNAFIKKRCGQPQCILPKSVLAWVPRLEGSSEPSVSQCLSVRWGIRWDPLNKKNHPSPTSITRNTIHLRSKKKRNTIHLLLFNFLLPAVRSGSNSYISSQWLLPSRKGAFIASYPFLQYIVDALKLNTLLYSINWIYQRALTQLVEFSFWRPCRLLALAKFGGKKSM